MLEERKEKTMLNSVSLQGRLVSTPELKMTTNEIPVTTFTVAISRSYVKKGEDRQTDFVDIVAWRNTAEFICRNFQKGQMIVLSGAIQTRIYTADDGKNRKVTEIVADKVYFCDRKENVSADDEEENWLD